MKFIVKGYPKNREFEIIDTKKGKVKVSDGLTNSRWVPPCDIAEVHDLAEGIHRNAKMTKDNDLFSLRKNYFKNELNDVDLMLAYLDRGMPGWLTSMAIGYSEEDFNYLYRESQSHQSYNGGFSPRTKLMNIQIQIATRLPLSVVNSEPQTGYGSESVIAQWIKHDFNPELDHVNIRRMESEQISDDLYVIRHFTDVSNLGELDGELTRISVYTRQSGNSNGWRGYDVVRKPKSNGDFEWKTELFEYNGQPYLNGAQQLMGFAESPIECLKGE